MALAGADGKQAAKLLRASVRQGAATLGELTAAALKRLLADPAKAKRARRLFTDREREALAQTLAATNATAELLGRARIARRLEQARQHADKFSDDSPTDLSCFDDKPVKPLAPLRALEYFRSLIPTLMKGDPGRWADDQHRVAFTLAKTTEETLLDRIQRLIGRVLATGEKVREAPQLIDRVLDDAGVAPSNPQYAEMVFRTNMMDSYQTGSWREMKEAGDEEFPAWKYVGIRDGRQGKDHEPHFDKYFPASVSFNEVRGKRVFNCRCSFIPVSKRQWARLQAEGAAFSSFSEALPVPHVRQSRPYTCGPAALASIAHYFGKTASEGFFESRLHTTAEAGTPPAAMIKGVRLLGLHAEAREGMTPADLERALDAGRPVLICLQAYGSPDERADLEAGHWVVVSGHEGGSFQLTDPASDEGALWLAGDGLFERWVDKDSQGRRYRRFGIVVSAR